jgi:hypothetical protein
VLCRQNRDETKQTRQQNAQKPVLDNILYSAALEQHQGEEAADQEEELHPKSVDAKENQPNPIRRCRVVAAPRHIRDIRHGGVQNDTEEHRIRAEGIEGVVAR